MTGTDFLLTWADQGATLLRQGWREMLLFLAMALAAGMLFWRLGERSRHAEQELVLDVVAEPEHDAFVEAVGIAAIATPSKESEPQETVQVQEEQEMAQETRLPEPKSDRRFATLHAALQEMKADMARNGGAVRRPVVPA